VAAPIRVPGLDLKHLPEVLFLPIAFPAAGWLMESLSLSRYSLGGEADYTVTSIGSAGATGVYSASYEFKVHQTYSDFEDDANQVVPEKDAAARVVTDVVGTAAARTSQARADSPCSRLTTSQRASLRTFRPRRKRPGS